MSNQNNNKNKDDNKNIKIILMILIALLAVLICVAIFLMNNKQKDNEDKTLAYTDLIKEISYGNVEKIEMTVGSTSIKGKMKKKKRKQLYQIQKLL